jgi:hypothetical protein
MQLYSDSTALHMHACSAARLLTCEQAAWRMDSLKALLMLTSHGCATGVQLAGTYLISAPGQCSRTQAFMERDNAHNVHDETWRNM